RYAFVAGYGLDVRQTLRHSNSAPPDLALHVRHVRHVGSWQLWPPPQSPARPHRVRCRAGTAGLALHQPQYAHQERSAQIRQRWWPIQYAGFAGQTWAAEFRLVRWRVWNLIAAVFQGQLGD